MQQRCLRLTAVRQQPHRERVAALLRGRDWGLPRLELVDFLMWRLSVRHLYPGRAAQQRGRPVYSPMQAQAEIPPLKRSEPHLALQKAHEHPNLHQVNGCPGYIPLYLQHVSPLTHKGLAMLVKIIQLYVLLLLQLSMIQPVVVLRIV